MWPLDGSGGGATRKIPPHTTILRLCLFSREASGEALCGKDCGGKLPFESLIFLNRGSRRERMSLLLWERLRNRNVGQTRLKYELSNYLSQQRKSKRENESPTLREVAK